MDILQIWVYKVVTVSASAPTTPQDVGDAYGGSLVRSP